VSAVYPLAVDAFERGEIDVLADTIKAQLVSGFEFDPTHAVAGDITDTVGAPLAVTVDRVEDGVIWLTGHPVVAAAVAVGPPVTALVFYVDGGPLLAHIDRRTDTVPLYIVPDGGPLTFTFDRLIKL
jgi:hypothetical protein